MTPDHQHATIAIAAMKKGKHVVMHKPIANRLYEARQVLETARTAKVATHFIPWDSNGSMDLVMAWIKDGAIGTLREVHNWTNRPVWPQYLTLPADQPPVPQGFDWDLWLGPALDRPYHPNYTHNVFRGWYDFGGGSIADMGHYSLWVVFRTLKLGAPVSVEARPSGACVIVDHVSHKIRNDYSFPLASTIRFKFAAREDMGSLDLYWYDGGMRPRTPEELEVDNKELEAEGMMFVGDKGKILTGALPSQRIKQRTWRWCGGVVSAATITGQHNGGRTVVLLNSVAKAQDLYLDLERNYAGEQNAPRLLLLHARYYLNPAHSTT